ncbi:MAG: alanine racemase domain protein [Actinomycetia bacterium]|nr:alanine racemase domain protein [Actinomycetes bacterium]
MPGLPPFALDTVDDTPEVVLDLGRVQRNVARAAATAAEHGVALRPHAKTHKLPPIAALQIEAGAVGIQVAKLGEAEVFAGAGIADIFVGYPLVGPRKIARLIELLETTSSRISVAADALEVVVPIARAAASAGFTVPVVIEVDTGLHRLGVQPGRPTVELASRLADLDGVDVAGVFTHEGHVYTEARSMEDKRAMTQAACAALADTAELVRASGIPLATVSVGSSGTFRFAVECPNITEIRPGTYVFNDLSQLLQGAATADDLAAFVVATVVGRPEATRAVIDAGSKVLTSDRLLIGDPGPTFGAVAGYPGAHATRLSEEHGLLEFPAPTDLRIGDRVAIVPNHICPVINLADSVSVIADGTVVERWEVSARGRVK